MGCWVAVFVSMFATGFVGSRHEGVSLAFWQRASEEGRWFASRNVLTILNSQAKAGSAEAFNELGLVHMEGKLVKRDPGVATHLFAKACELGNSAGCANAAIQFLFHGTAKSLDEAGQVLDYLENAAAHGTNAVACYLMGFAFDSGRGRPVDRSKAVELYAKGCDLGNIDACKALARMRLSGETVATADQVVRALEKACGASDAEACMYLALVYHNGDGVPRDEAQALSLLKKACELGAGQACAMLKERFRPSGPTGP
jgi:TPR repeat protein